MRVRDLVCEQLPGHLRAAYTCLKSGKGCSPQHYSELESILRPAGLARQRRFAEEGGGQVSMSRDDILAQVKVTFPELPDAFLQSLSDEQLGQLMGSRAMGPASAPGGATGFAERTGQRRGGSVTLTSARRDYLLGLTERGKKVLKAEEGTKQNARIFAEAMSDVLKPLLARR